MSSLDLVRSIYKPYRYTINKSATIIDSSSGKFVIKKQNKDLYQLFNYLSTRGFNSYPRIVRNYRSEENIFEYIENEYVPNEQKLLDLSNALASLHNKTVYYKNTSLDNYKEIYENITNNISYLSTYYESMFLTFLKEEYQSPSMYLYSRNYYKIRSALSFCKDEIDSWYELVKENDKERVSVVHNNIEMDHFLENKNGSVLISWDNYIIDTPIIDFINLYQKEYLNYNFEPFLTKYLNNFTLLEHEKKLLFVLINLPLYFELNDSEFENTRIIKNNLEYIFKSEKLTRPYYSSDKEE